MSRFLAPLASVLFAFLAWPVHALGKAAIRFVHALPGAQTAELTVEQAGRTTQLGRADYAEHTAVRAVQVGALRWRITSDDKTLATGTGRIADGTYTAVAVPDGDKVALRIYRDAGRVPGGKTRVRVIHASPEFGSPDLLVDGDRVATKLGYGQATPYLPLTSGAHDLAAVRAGTTDALLSKRVSFPRRTTTNVLVIGTRGEPARVIAISDRVARRAKAGASSRSAGRSNGGSGHGGASSHVVVPGDSLWSIARDRLGRGASRTEVAREVRRLWDLNHVRIGTGDKDLIFPGTKLRLS